MGKRTITPGHSAFEFRPGVGGFPDWEGLDLRADAAAIPPNRLREAKNIRFMGREIRARGGQSKLINTALQPILGIFETGTVSEESEKILGLGSGVGGDMLLWTEDHSDGGTLRGYAPHWSPTTQKLKNAPQLGMDDGVQAIIMFKGELYALGLLGTNAKASKLRLTTGPTLTVVSTATSSGTAWDSEQTDNTYAWNGSIIIGLTGGASVQTYNGTTFATETHTLGASTWPTCILTDDTTFMVMARATSTTVKAAQRNAAGTWATVTDATLISPDSSYTVSLWVPRGGAYWNGAYWFTGLLTVINGANNKYYIVALKWSGSAWTQHTLQFLGTTAAAAANTHHDFAKVFDSRLYFTAQTDDSKCALFVFDGLTTQEAYDFDDVDEITTKVGPAGGLIATESTLVVGVDGDPVAGKNQAFRYASSGSDTTTFTHFSTVSSDYTSSIIGGNFPQLTT